MPAHLRRCDGIVLQSTPISLVAISSSYEAFIAYSKRCAISCRVEIIVIYQCLARAMCG
jgi:hypothetical protein